MAEENVEISRLLIERETEKAKNEFEKLRSELIETVAQAKVEIGQSAVDKMSSAFNFFRTSVLIALAVLAAIGGLSYVSIESSARKIIQTKIDDWLSFEKKGALLKDSLEAIRMRTVLDSLVIQVARNNLDRRRFNLEMSEVEKARLIAYMEDPSTSESDFRDAARVLSATFGMFNARFSDPKIDQMLRPVFSQKSYSDPKRLILLESLKNYVGIVDYAYHILNLQDAPVRWKIAAFESIDQYSDAVLIDYSRKNLLKEKDRQFQFLMARSLVSQPDSSPLNDWLQRYEKQDGGAITYIQLADSLTTHFDQVLPIENDNFLAKKRAANFIFRAIELGSRLSVCDPFPQDSDLCFKSKNNIASVARPTKFFGRDAHFLEELVSIAAQKKFAPQEFIRALTTSDRYGSQFGIKIISLNDGSIKGKNYGVISSRTSAGSIFLSHDVQDDTVYANFRSLNGSWIRDEIIQYSDFYKMTSTFAFDEAFMQASEMRNFRKIDQDF